MDVHAPYEPVHTWKDIAIHLGIVTVGLFIALMLEGLVEYVHHRHIVAEARANIRTELENNHAAAQQDVKSLSENLKNVATNIQTIQRMEKAPGGHWSLINRMIFSELDDAAWRTARDTGALAYMPYDEVQRYSDIYALQQTVNSKAQGTANKEFLAMTPVVVASGPNNLPASDYAEMLHDNGATMIELCTLKQYVQQLDAQYIDELKLKEPAPKVDDCRNFQ